MSKSIKIQGLDKLIQGLRKRENTTPVKKVVLRNIIQMENNAKRLSPVDTGSLRRLVLPTFANGGMTGILISNAEYSGYQEWGTRFIPSHPYMRPAFERQMPIFIRDLKRLVEG